MIVRLKIINELNYEIRIPQSVFRFIRLQDFIIKSNIDWSKSIYEINKQLYKKYGFKKEEIGFMASMIKPMK